MAPRLYSRIYHRFPLWYPVIFGGAPFVGEGSLTNLSLMGYSVMCDREVLCGSDVRVSALLPNQTSTLSIESISAGSNGSKVNSVESSFCACRLRQGNVSIVRYESN